MKIGKSQSGSALIGVIAAILAMGAISAGVVATMSTSSMSDVHGNHAARAYYLAESGFHYATATLRNEGDDAFWSLDGTTTEVPGGGQFSLALSNLSEDEGYDKTHQVNGEQTINPGDDLDLATGASLAPKNGLFQAGEGGSFYRYREFRDNTLIDIIGAPDIQRKVDEAQTINSGDNLAILDGSTIPTSEGIFEYDGKSYNYDALQNGELTNVTSEDSGAFPVNLNNNEELDFPSIFPLEVEDGDELTFAEIT